MCGDSCEVCYLDEIEINHGTRQRETRAPAEVRGGKRPGSFSASSDASVNVPSYT